MANAKSLLVANESPHPGRARKAAAVRPYEPLDGAVEGGGCGRFELQTLLFVRLPPLVLASRIR